MSARPARFATWWRHFERTTHDHALPERAARLGRKLRRVRVAERRDFARDLWETLLQRNHAYGVALLLLQELTDTDYLHDMADRLLPLPGAQSREREAHLAELMRVMAAAGIISAVEEYLLRREIASPWTTVPWALWPAHPDLFARAWRRYAVERGSRAWSDEQTLKPFLSDPEAIRTVRNSLIERDSQIWEPMRSALTHLSLREQWMTEEHRLAFERAVA